MPSYSEQSAHNKNAHDLLGTRSPEYPDWQITALFYSALHLFNHHFELRGIRKPENHRQRYRLIARELPHTAKDYTKLKSLSEQARYGGRAEISASSIRTAVKSYSEIVKHLA